MDWNGDGHIDGQDGSLFHNVIDNQGGSGGGSGGSGGDFGCLGYVLVGLFILWILQLFSKLF